MDKFNNKKTIIILILLLLVGIVGVTIAYFSNTTSINNLFSTKEYGTTVTEEFVSPDNWLPGTTTDKKINVTNSGKVDEAVRISYTEKWVAKDGTILSGLIDSNGNLTNNTENSEHAAIINFSDNGDWNYSNGYYYYNYKLSPNNTTSTLIDSVTFNSKVKNSSNCTTTDNNGTKTITCNSTNNGYDGATYTLTFKVETIQYDKYKQAWGIDITLLDSNGYKTYKRGDEVIYDGSKYYVLYDSDKDENYITVLKANLLTANEINEYSTDYTSIDGEYPFSISDSSYSFNYNQSDIKTIVDNWSKKYENDLVIIDNYKSRLLNRDDLIESLGYEIEYVSPNFISDTTEDTPEWAIFSGRKYWTIDTKGVSTKMTVERANNLLYIRPVINLRKCALDGSCSYYLICDKGDKVNYKNSEYYTLEDSDSSTNYVTLLKKDFLTTNEVNQYREDYVSENGEYPYYESDKCNSEDSSECANDYQHSDVKKIIDSWANSFDDNLIDIDGYKARLLNNKELNKNFYYAGLYYQYNTPDWFIDNLSYWTMDKTDYSNNRVFAIDSEIDSYGGAAQLIDIFEKKHIRPVINLNKKAIESGCHLNSNSNSNNNSNNNNSNSNDNDSTLNYTVGSIFNYRNNEYCVIDNVGYKDYIILIKQKPLTYEELETYNNGYEIGRDIVDNNSGIISYYKSDTCYYISDDNKNLNGCTNDYNNSYIKNVINNWSNDFSNELKEVDGYKARLITNNELSNMGHIYHSRTASVIVTKSEYNCLYSNEDYWTMSAGEDFTSIINIVSNTDANNGFEFVGKKYAVRPVINLKRCVIEGTC